MNIAESADPTGYAKCNVVSPCMLQYETIAEICHKDMKQKVTA